MSAPVCNRIGRYHRFGSTDCPVCQLRGAEKDDYPVTLETPDNLEKTMLLDLVRCCRDWPVAVGSPIGRCGLCGQHPRFIRRDPTS